MKKVIDKYVPAFIEQLGLRINPLLLRFRDEHNQLLVFYFHGLYESAAHKALDHVDPQNNLTVDQFRAFVNYFLEHQYQFIRPDELVKELPQGQSYVMITFDDGYYNNWLALEVLDRYKIPATFFITTRNILENRSYWWDIIYKYRKQDGWRLPKIRLEQEQLKVFSSAKIDAYIEKTFGPQSVTPWSDIDRPFRPAELQFFAENQWVCIGNHTKSHSILTNCKAEEIQQELSASNQVLANLLGKTPDTIAFPNGDYNELVLRCAKKAGFRFAFTTDARLNPLPLDQGDLICLHRFMAKTEAVKRYGSFSRLGYTPDGWYADLKNRIKSIREGEPLLK